MQALIEKAKHIKCLVCDVDGVLTDGHLYYNHTGMDHLRFHVHDGIGIKLLQNMGIHIAIITTSNNKIIDNRVGFLGIEHYYKGKINKNIAYQDLTEKLKLNDEQIAYVGDDIPDLPLIQRVGLGVAVANCNDSIREHADWITTKHGGQGAVREVCDLIMQAQDSIHNVFDDYKSKA